VELIERRKKFLENESSSVGEDGEEIKTNTKQPSGPKWEWDDTIKQAPEGFQHANHFRECAEEVKKDPPPPAAGVSPPKEKPVPKKNSDKKSIETREKRKKERKNKKPAPEKSTALLNVIYPTLGKLAKNTKDDQVILSLNQLKTAFDQAESTQPGITHNFIAQVIDTLKRN